MERVDGLQTLVGRDHHQAVRDAHGQLRAQGAQARHLAATTTLACGAARLGAIGGGRRAQAQQQR